MIITQWNYETLIGFENSQVANILFWQILVLYCPISLWISLMQ